MKCEACNLAPVTMELKDRGFNNEHIYIYRLCNNCLFSFVNLNLAPQQFKNLLDNGHSRDEFYLHSDFYDEEGYALQPKR